MYRGLVMKDGLNEVLGELSHTGEKEVCQGNLLSEMCVKESTEKLETTEEKRFRRYGHVQGMSDDKRSNRIILWILPYRMKKGRQRKSWTPKIYTAVNWNMDGLQTRMRCLCTTFKHKHSISVNV